MHNPFGSFVLALMFFSRIPLPKMWVDQVPENAKLKDAVALFPIIGLLIGLFPGLVWFLANQFFPASLSACLAVAVGLIITGALHEDGIADCADGLGATPDREKALDIMRDSTIGTYGALALIVSIGTRAVALSLLSPLTGLIALVIAHAGSRGALSLPLRFSSYARKKGLGELVDGEISDIGWIAALVIAFGIAFLTGWASGLIALIAGLVASWMFLKYLEHRLGGYTGDGLGAIQQITEITIMVVLVGFWA
ncbi:MAG: adenosylcobinamide-GDP ribazoletransferase [Pseudomonadota bacterium]